MHCDPTADTAPLPQPKPGAALHTLHADAPDALNVPARHTNAAGSGDVEPAGHAYPALQSLHDAAPARLKLPAAHNAAVGVVEPAAHA